MIAPVYIANNFLARGQRDAVDISPLKLQKLVYFLYKEYLQRTGSQLFSEQFETWKYGPVIPSIYAEFHSYGSSPIKTFAVDSQNKCYVVTESGIFGECIQRVWDRYSGFSATVLSDMTHKPESAWSKAKDNKQRYLKAEDIRNEVDLLVC